MKLPNVGISCYPSQGGSGVVASELGLHLARRGCAVHFISSSLPFRLRGYRENLSYHQVEMPQYPLFQHSPYTLSLASMMFEVAQRHHLDILHVHYAIPHAASAFLAQRMIGPDRIKVITTLHGTDITLVGQEPSFFPITRFLIEQSDAVTAVSDWLRQETLDVFGIERDIEVIPNFVDPRIFQPRPEGQERQFAAENECLIIHASNFRKVKNIPVVLEVFRRVQEAIPARLLMVGDGPERVTAEQTVDELGLADRVRFLGPVDHLHELMPAADVLLLPSMHESFGLVALEAMACGVVPVVTNQGGTGDFIVEGVNGFLRDPHDAEGMAGVVIEFFQDSALRQNMSEEARREAVSEFGASCIMLRYLALYDRLLGWA